MPLITTNKLPPGGWQYEQKDNTGVVVRARWQNTMSPYQDFVKEVLQFRTANGYAGANRETVDEEVQDFLCAKNPGICQSEKKTTIPDRPFRRPAREVREDVAHAIAAFGKENEIKP
jgi:hypothetical protein